MKTTSTTHKVTETIVGATVGAAIAGPAGAIAGGIVGSQVAAHNRQPAAEDECTPKVVHDEEDNPAVETQVKRILAPMDFSPSSRRALLVARDWAARFGAEVRLLHVIEPASTFSILDAGPINPTTTPDDLRQDLHTELMKLGVEEFPNASKVSVELRDGSVSDQIVSAAREWNADLLIISTHGRTGLSHVLLGSTAEQVVRHAPCPVLTLRRA